MPKPPPNPEILHRRNSLREMVERGTRHEAVVAAAKLAALEERYDFSGKVVSETPTDDLFSTFTGGGIGGGTSRSIISIPTEDEEIGNFVKWAFLHKFALESHWDKNKPGSSVLMASIEKSAADSPRSVAKVILAQFKGLWLEYSKKNTLRLNQRRPFFCGLYDGMMETPRTAGERIPMVSGVRKPKRGKKPSTSTASDMDAHPYEIGLTLGAMIRTNLPLSSLKTQLHLMMQPPQHATS